MTKPEPLPDTRTRILRAALAEFEKHGFHGTSVRQIAERVGLTKAAVLYHFPEKVDLLGALAAPMLQGLEAAVAAADLVKPSEARWSVIEGLLEVFLSNRFLLRMSLHDLTLTSGKSFERFRDVLMRANALVAGRRPTVAERIRAAQAVSMLGDPVVLYAELPTDELRAGVLEGVRRLFSEPAPLPSHVRRGRKQTLSAAQVEAARRFHAAGSSAAAIGKKLGVSRATIYRHLGLS